MPSNKPEVKDKEQARAATLSAAEVAAGAGAKCCPAAEKKSVPHALFFCFNDDRSGVAEDSAAVPPTPPSSPVLGEDGCFDDGVVRTQPTGTTIAGTFQC